VQLRVGWREAIGGQLQEDQDGAGGETGSSGEYGDALELVECEFGCSLWGRHGLVCLGHEYQYY